MKESKGSPENETSDAAEEQELYEHHRIVADPAKALCAWTNSCSTISQALRDRASLRRRGNGNVLVNGVARKPSHKVKPKDEVSLVLPYPMREVELTPENIPLEVLYEDSEILLINKQPGLVVHPGHGNWTGTLVNGLLYHFGKLPSSPNQPVPRPGLVHRLDKNTSA